MLIRPFGVAITIATLWWPSSSFGLGLGEINVESTLASPLKATIPLRGMDKIDLSPDQYFIRLDGTSKLKIQFRLERTDTNTATIILYTREAVTEPLFHFRIEVEWDEGIIARSYDVLVDPASYKLNSPAEETTTSVPDEISESVSEPIDTNLPITPSVAETAITPSENHTGELDSSTTESRREYGPTENGNSIWRVANKVATESKELSVYQWMYGIWKANPQAFTRSNMHRLKIDEFISAYINGGKYPKERLKKTVFCLMDFKLQFFLITEVDEWSYPSRGQLTSPDRMTAANAELRQLSINQSLVGKSRVLWERLMNLVYYMETGKDLVVKKSKKTAFFKFVDGCPTWKFLSAYKDTVDEFDNALRTPEFHKGSVLRSNLMGNKEISFEEFRKLYGSLLNGIWENLCSIAAGGKASAFTNVHMDDNGELKEEYRE